MEGTGRVWTDEGEGSKKSILVEHKDYGLFTRERVAETMKGTEAASLPLLSLKVSGGAETGIALQGVTRKGGKLTADEEDASTGRRRTTSTLLIPTGSGATRLNAMASELRLRSSGPTSLANRWRASLQASMNYKQELYTQERMSIQREVDDAQAKAAAFVRQARRGGDDALADSATSTWDVAEKVSSRWQSLVLLSASLDIIVQKARERHGIVNNIADFATLRNELAVAVSALAADYGSLPVLLESVADLIEAFVSKPLVANTSMLNYVLMGQPGVGKTRLAGALAAVLGKLGLFVFDQLVECGRSDFVAEYEGQTSVKSRNFLMANLEKVVFLDEAYSLTTWEQPASGTDRKLSAYSGEAVTEIVAFLSQRTGAIGFIAAGYELEMLRDFLPANPGLSRRFTNRIWLTEYTAEQLVDIYFTALANALSDPPPAQPLTRSTTRTFFTELAVSLLTDILESSRDAVAYPLLQRMFAAQAGAMSTLASVTAILVASSKRGGEIGTSSTGLDTWAISFTDVYDILATWLQQQLGPQASGGLEELQNIASVNGWFANGAWRVPPERVTSQPSRARKKRV